MGLSSNLQMRGRQTGGRTGQLPGRSARKRVQQVRQQLAQHAPPQAWCAAERLRLHRHLRRRCAAALCSRQPL